MFARHIGVRAVHALALAGIIVSVGGCAAKVKREDFNNEMARLREEIAGGDRQVGTQLGTRIDSTNRAVADQNRRIEALSQELQAFRSEFKTSVEKMQSMLKFNVPVHFAFDSADVRAEDRAVLDRFASVVKEYYPNALITVEGFTDAAGSATYNQRLGMQRAEAVKNYLATTGGFEVARLKAVSYGESRNRQVEPGAAGPGDAGVANRRVVLVVDHASVVTDRLALQ